MSVPLPLRGGCLCGGVRYEIDRPLELATYCHCKRCQRRSGTAASAQGVLAAGSLRIVGGAELVRYFRPPDGYEKGFCTVCGSALFSRPAGASEPTTVRLGGFDGDPGVRPSVRQRVESAAAWEPIPDDGLPRHRGPMPGVR